MLDDDVPLGRAVELLRQPDVTDGHRLAAVLYACAEPQGPADGLDLAILRVAGDTAADADFPRQQGPSTLSGVGRYAVD